MKVIHQSRQSHPDASQKMLTATPTVGKAIMMAGFALIFGIMLLVAEIRWIANGIQFRTNHWVFTLVMLALLIGGILLGRRIPRSIKLERNGIEVDGHVIGGWRDVDDDNDVHYYLAFAAGNLTFKQQVKQRQFAAYEPGDEVSVIQLPDQPEIARIIFP